MGIPHVSSVNALRSSDRPGFSRRTLRLPLLAAGVLLATPAAHAQTERVVVDGVFNDWTDDAVAYADAAGDGPSGVDLGRLWAARAEGHLLLSFEVGAEINLQSGNALTLYVDADADPATGLPVGAGVGAELEWRFGERAGTAYLPGHAPAPIAHTDLGFFSAPTVTATRFEVAFRDDAAVQGVPLFPGDPMRVVLRDGLQGDRLPDAGGAPVDPTPSPTPTPAVTLERESTAHLRVMTHNVLQDGLFNPARAAYFGRLFRAVQPDVIALQEVYTHTAAEVEAQVEALLPSPPGERWYAGRAAPGSDVFLASRYPITRIEPLCANAALASTCNGAFTLDLSARYARDLYVVAAHPPCCTTGNNEAFRQEEVDLIAAHLRDARADGRLPADTPFVITGDLNLVGLARQLRTLLTGDIFDNARFGPDAAPDWDGSELGDARPLTTGVPGAFTWYDEGSDFHPGRLDFILYSDAVVTAAHRFALFTPAIPTDVLAAYGLTAGDSPGAADHIPVVVDLALPPLTTSTGGAAPAPGVRFDRLSPSPTRGHTLARLVLTQPTHVRVDVLDGLGRVVWTAREHRAAGAHEVPLELGGLPAGVYVVRVVTDAETAVRRLVLTR